MSAEQIVRDIYEKEKMKEGDDRFTGGSSKAQTPYLGEDARKWKLRNICTDLRNVIVKHKAGSHKFVSIFTKSGEYGRVVEDAIMLTFSSVPKKVIFEDDDGTLFTGNRLADDLTKGYSYVYHVATFCVDKAEDAEGAYHHAMTQTYPLPLPDRVYKGSPYKNADETDKYELRIELSMSKRVGYAIVDALIASLIDDCKFAVFNEWDVIPCDDNGVAQVDKHIVINATGHYITHGTCKCGETLGCQYFNTFGEAREYRDGTGTFGDNACCECYHKNVAKEQVGNCDYCLWEGDCPRTEAEEDIEPCPHWEYNDSWCEDYDGPDNECSCPLERE